MPPSTLSGFRLAPLLLAVFVGAGAAQAQTVRIESQPAGARVEIDGVYVGATPVVRSVAAGRREIRVRRQGFAIWQRQIEVAVGDTTQVAVVLDRLLGTLALDGLPDGATVTVDGAPVAPTSEVGVGLATVVVQVPGRRDAQQRVPIADGGVTHVTYAARQFTLSRVATSLVAPGVVQITGDRPLVGVAVLAGVVGAGSLVLISERGMQDARADYDDAVGLYTGATSEANVNRALRQIEQSTDRARRLRSTRRVALGVGAAVYLAGSLDAILNHAFRPGLRASAPTLPPVSLRVQDAGLSLSVRLSR